MKIILLLTIFPFWLHACGISKVCEWFCCFSLEEETENVVKKDYKIENKIKECPPSLDTLFPELKFRIINLLDFHCMLRMRECSVYWKATCDSLVQQWCCARSIKNPNPLCVEINMSPLFQMNLWSRIVQQGRQKYKPTGDPSINSAEIESLICLTQLNLIPTDQYFKYIKKNKFSRMFCKKPRGLCHVVSLPNLDECDFDLINKETDFLKKIKLSVLGNALDFFITESYKQQPYSPELFSYENNIINNMTKFKALDDYTIDLIFLYLLGNPGSYSRAFALYGFCVARQGYMVQEICNNASGLEKSAGCKQRLLNSLDRIKSQADMVRFLHIAKAV